MEPPQLPIPCGPASKSEKSMFFEPASLNIIQNFIFKLWIEQEDSWADFDIYKSRPFWSPWSPTAKNRLKILVKLKLTIISNRNRYIIFIIMFEYMVHNGISTAIQHVFSFHFKIKRAKLFLGIAAHLDGDNIPCNMVDFVCSGDTSGTFGGTLSQISLVVQQLDRPVALHPDCPESDHNGRSCIWTTYLSKRSCADVACFHFAIKFLLGVRRSS